MGFRFLELVGGTGKIFGFLFREDLILGAIEEGREAFFYGFNRLRKENLVADLGLGIFPGLP